MCSAQFRTVPSCLRIQGFSFYVVPFGSVSFHRIAAIFAADHFCRSGCLTRSQVHWHSVLPFITRTENAHLSLLPFRALEV